MASKQWRTPDVFGYVTLASGRELNLDGSLRVDRLRELTEGDPVAAIGGTGKVVVNFGRGKPRKLARPEQVNEFLHNDKRV
jgi:hypothetical protein